MRNVKALAVSGLAILGLACAAVVHAQAATPVAPPSPSAGTPILVELFTSEGCSSCPSADAVMTKLEGTQPVAGARIIVLAHHVDYWDGLGWPDPWSSAAATTRQQSFKSLNASSYTPQAVVDGRSEGIGSRSSLVESKVEEAAKAPHITVGLDVTRVDSAFDVNVRAALPADAEIVIAVVQDRGRTDVKKGENSGRTLDHTSIVRSMTTGPKARVTIPKAINAPAGGSTFSIVAFAQERSSRKILGSNATRVP